MIFVDSQVLNYSTFYPGKMLGSTLSVGNLSACEQIVELSVDNLNAAYNKSSIRERFYDAVLPFSLEESNNYADSVPNSEVAHEAWYIENPVSKELTKRITLKLGPKAEQDFIIVVRAPSSRRTENLLSIINIGLLTYADEKFGVKVSFEDFLRTQFEGSMKDFLKDRRKAALTQRLEILLAGQVQIPKLVCQKTIKPEFFKNELVAEEESQIAQQEQIVPLAMKNMGGLQKFRIPFKNLSDHDIEVEFNFMQASMAVSQPALERHHSAGENAPTDRQSPIEFSI